MRELLVAMVCVLPMSAWAWTNIQPSYVNLSPDQVALLLASGKGRGHGGAPAGAGPASPSPAGSVSTADPTRGEPSGVIQLQPVPSPQPVQLQMQRVQPVPTTLPAPAPAYQLVPMPSVTQPVAPVTWEGGTVVAVPVTIRLGVGQAAVGAPCPAP